MDATRQRLVFTGERSVACLADEVPEPAAEQVLVRAHRSLLSTGTETIAFARRFDPGTSWDRWVRYPFYPGYALVGEVVAAGSAVHGLGVGARVALRHSHASHALAEPGQCHAIPPGLDDDAACWFALAKIAYMGARAAPMSLGDRVLVIGAGPIGQMSLRWAVAAGAERVAVLDPVQGRLALAERGGASDCIALPIGEAAAEVARIFGPAGPNLVIDATGHHEVLAQALPLVAPRGTLLLIGDTGRPASQHLTSDVIGRGIRIVGAHDCHETAEWTSRRIMAFIFDLAVRGRFPLAGLTSHHFEPSACAAAYALALERRGETMGIAFDWRSAA